jgi:hypothetical protein
LSCSTNDRDRAFTFPYSIAMQEYWYIGLQMAAEEAIKEWIENNTLVDSALHP